jgi:hypothetical protein
MAGVRTSISGSLDTHPSDRRDDGQTSIRKSRRTPKPDHHDVLERRWR